MTSTANAATIDLPEVRRNLVRLAGVQLVLLVGILLAWRLLGGLSALLTVWLAALPVLLVAWSAVYYRALERAHAAGGGKVAFTAANKRAISLLAILGFVWFLGLVVVGVYSVL